MCAFKTMSRSFFPLFATLCFTTPTSRKKNGLWPILITSAVRSRLGERGRMASWLLLPKGAISHEAKHPSLVFANNSSAFAKKKQGVVLTFADTQCCKLSLNMTLSCTVIRFSKNIFSTTTITTTWITTWSDGSQEVKSKKEPPTRASRKREFAKKGILTFFGAGSLLSFLRNEEQYRTYYGK